MKLTKKQKDELFNCHEGVGFLAMKTRNDELVKIEFYVDGFGDIRYLTDDNHSPRLDLNVFVKTEGELNPSRNKGGTK